MFVYTIVYTIAVDTTTKVGQNVVVDDLAFPVNTPQFQQDYHRGFFCIIIEEPKSWLVLESFQIHFSAC